MCKHLKSFASKDDLERYINDYDLLVQYSHRPDLFRVYILHELHNKFPNFVGECWEDVLVFASIFYVAEIFSYSHKGLTAEIHELWAASIAHDQAEMARKLGRPISGRAT